MIHSKQPLQPLRAILLRMIVACSVVLHLPVGISPGNIPPLPVGMSPLQACEERNCSIYWIKGYPID